MQTTRSASVSCPKCGGPVQEQGQQWKCIQCSFWISAFDSIGQRRSAQDIDKEVLKAGGKPQVQTQQPPARVTACNSPNQSSQSTLDKVPRAAREHPNYMEGDGTRESPFVIHTSNTIRSAQIQREIIDGIFGPGTKESASRHYYESPRGLPGNGDLCEHRFALGGVQKSVWFDLHVVTRMVNDPELNRFKQDMMSQLSKNPEFVRLQNGIRQRLGLPVQRQPRGCLGVVALFIGIIVLIWLGRHIA